MLQDYKNVNKMKVPDYLFVRVKNNVLLDTSFVPTDGSITYICKDTLLDWIKEQEKELDYGIAVTKENNPYDIELY